MANAFYRGQPDLLLLCIDETGLSAELRWEAPAHPRPGAAVATVGETVFPHVYGRLNLDAVACVIDLVETDGGFTLPRDLRGE